MKFCNYGLECRMKTIFQQLKPFRIKLRPKSLIVLCELVQPFDQNKHKRNFDSAVSITFFKNYCLWLSCLRNPDETSGNWWTSYGLIDFLTKFNQRLQEYNFSIESLFQIEPVYFGYFVHMQDQLKTWVGSLWV